MFALRDNVVTQNEQVNRSLPELQKKDVRSVLDRLHLVFGVKNDSQLCGALEVNRSTVGSWISRDSVPYAICVNVAEAMGVSLDWLLAGEGPMLRGEGAIAAPSAPGNPREEALLALFRELDEGGQREIQSAAEEKKRLSSLEQRLAELEAVVADIKRLA
jgi:hypothetical protein